MTQFKGTQGKWHLMKKGFTKNANDNLIQVYATNKDLEFVCQVWNDGILHDKTQNFEANAQLISKAPEMLEMLNKAIGLIMAINDEVEKRFKENSESYLKQSESLKNYLKTKK